MSRATPAPMSARPALVWAALGIVYVVWGSTYLAIRVAIDTLPPFLMAATRFLVAGGVLLALTAWLGDRTAPRGARIGARQWRAAFIVGAALLGGGNGGVVWAEQRIPSGVAALLIATVALWLTLLDRVVNGRRLARHAVAGLGLGLAGMALLVGPAEDGAAVDPWGVVACTMASLSWAAGSLYARGAPLPRRPIVATGMEMVAGGLVLLLVGVASGELVALRPEAFSTASLLALAYLTVFGSLVAFSAYVFLLRAAPVALVATYAYVNPVVAVALGAAFLGEPVSTRMLVAGGIIVASVALIAGASPPEVPPDDTAVVDEEPRRAVAGT